MSAPSPAPLSEKAFDVLRTAVTLAKNANIRSVATLKLRLSQEYPEIADAVIDEALQFWAQREWRLGLRPQT